MKLPEMKTGLTISVCLHLALLLWGLVSLAVRPLDAMPNESLPIDIISDKQFSEITKGVKNAPKFTKPSTMVEKIGDPKPADDSSAKITEKKELKTAKADDPPPPPPKPDPKPEPPKPEKTEPPKPDPIAETLKKEEAKKKAEAKEQAKKDEAKKKADAKAKAEEQKKLNQPKFDANKIAALLDKREPQRQAMTGAVLDPTASLGFSGGQAAQLSQSEIDALRRRLGECWHPPVGAADGGNLKVVLRVLFRQDGSVAAQPQLVAGTPSSFGPAMAESATRAVLTCQPFTMLRPEHYAQWKDIEITFDPREMFGAQ